MAEALRSVVADPAHGAAALSDPRLLSRLLADAGKERQVIIAAAEADMAVVLLDRAGHGTDPLIVVKLAASHFAAASPFAPEICDWAALHFALALGLKVPAVGSAPTMASGCTPGEIAGPSPVARPSADINHQRPVVSARQSRASAAIAEGRRRALDRLSDSERAEVDAGRLYADLGRIDTAPLLAGRLRRLAAEAGGTAPPGRAGIWPADVDAIRADLLIPSGQAFDEFVVSCGVRPEHLGPWHDALRKVMTATAGVINLRTSAIELARSLDQELKASRHRQSSNLWNRARIMLKDQRDDPRGLNRASTYGQLHGQIRTLVEQLGTDRSLYRNKALPMAPRSLIKALQAHSDFDSPDWLVHGAKGAKGAVAALAAVQIDASGVDLTSLSLPEPDAVIGVVWTAHTRWPPQHADAISARSKPIGHAARKVVN